MKPKDMRTKNLQKIIEIIETVSEKITAKTDVSWTKFDHPNALKLEIEKALQRIEEGNLDKLKLFDLYFSPTGVFQEISISNGWSEEYIKLSTEFDRLYELISRS